MRRGGSFLTTVTVLGLVLTACSNVVRMPDAYNGEPIDVAPDQVFEIELGTARSVSETPDAYEWIVVDEGVMKLQSVTTVKRGEDPDEFAAGYNLYSIFTFSPATTGVGDIVFAYVPVGAPETEALMTETVTINATG
jgi:hypothetical protein